MKSQEAIFNLREDGSHYYAVVVGAAFENDIYLVDFLSMFYSLPKSGTIIFKTRMRSLNNKSLVFEKEFQLTAETDILSTISNIYEAEVKPCFLELIKLRLDPFDENLENLRLDLHLIENPDFSYKGLMNILMKDPRMNTDWKITDEK